MTLIQQGKVIASPKRDRNIVILNLAWSKKAMVTIIIQSKAIAIAEQAQ